MCPNSSVLTLPGQLFTIAVIWAENIDINNPRIKWRKGEASNAQQCVVLFLKH